MQITITKRTVPQAVFDSEDALRVARAGHEAACNELANTPAHMLDVGNPNHPIYDGIFGYDRDEFLARQYHFSADIPWHATPMEVVS